MISVCFFFLIFQRGGDGGGNSFSCPKDGDGIVPRHLKSGEALSSAALRPDQLIPSFSSQVRVSSIPFRQTGLCFVSG